MPAPADKGKVQSHSCDVPMTAEPSGLGVGSHMPGGEDRGSYWFYCAVTSESSVVTAGPITSALPTSALGGDNAASHVGPIPQ